MNSITFIQECKALMTRMGVAEEMERPHQKDTARKEIQKDLTSLLCKMTNPTLPSGQRLVKMAKEQGYTIEARIHYQIRNFL